MKRLHVSHSPNPDCPGGSAGVTIVINKELIHLEATTSTVLIPGRAIHVSITWKNGLTLSIINTYAPNALAEHPSFWTALKNTCLMCSIPSPELLTGDFNITDDPIDRAPAHPDPPTAVQALREFRNTYNLSNYWCLSHPSDHTFTFHNNTNSMSRLNCIYASPTMEHSLSSWDYSHTLIPSDHKMVTVRFAPPQLPMIGKGRWTWPLGLLNDQDLTNTTLRLGQDLQSDIENLPEVRSTVNP